MTLGGQIKWFGEPWGAQINRVCEEVPIPVGDPCAYCSHEIHAGERGVLLLHVEGRDEPHGYRPWHLSCFLRSVIPPPVLERTLP